MKILHRQILFMHFSMFCQGPKARYAAMTSVHTSNLNELGLLVYVKHSTHITHLKTPQFKMGIHKYWIPQFFLSVPQYKTTSNFIEALKIQMFFTSSNSEKTLEPMQTEVYLPVNDKETFQEKNTHKNLIKPHTHRQTEVLQAASILFLPEFRSVSQLKEHLFSFLKADLDVISFLFTILRGYQH